MGRYCYDKATRLKDVFPHSFVRGLGVRAEQMNSPRYSITRKSRHVQKIFAEALNEIVERCIQEDVSFRGIDGSFRIDIRKKADADLERIMRIKNIYASVNLIESEFNIYEFIFYSFGYKKFASIRISHSKYHTLIDLVNKGKRYQVNKKKRLSMSQVAKNIQIKFPNTPPEHIEIIIRQGMDAMKKCVVNDLDMLIEHRKIPIRFLVYKPNFAIRKKWAQNKVKTHLQEA